MREINLKRSFTIYSELIKYKLSLAVVLSSVTGYFLYRNSVDYHLFFLVLGIFLLASGSAALNQYTERDSDSMMERTQNRPIPSKKISELNALIFASVLLITGTVLLLINGTIPCILGILNVLLYNLLYTRLKKATVTSIIPGALVGAIPPVIGFTSAGGEPFQQVIITFSAFMFLWQLPHFWLIIIKYGKEYKAAGFATISKYLSDIQIRYLVFFWVVLTTGFLFLFFLLAENLNKNIFIILAFLNIAFIYFFYRLLFIRKGITEIRGAFILINSFSFLIMFLLIALSIMHGI